MTGGLKKKTSTKAAVKQKHTKSKVPSVPPASADINSHGYRVMLSEDRGRGGGNLGHPAELKDPPAHFETKKMVRK